MIPYLRAANVKDGALDLSDVKVMNFDPLEQKAFSLQAGDILVTEGSGSIGAIGASAVWNADLPGPVCFQNTLVRLRPRHGVSDGRYLAWWARAAYASGQFASIASGASIYHISAERLKGLTVPLPSLDRQRRISDLLHIETARINELIVAHLRVIELAEERTNSQILAAIGESGLVQAVGGSVAPMRRLLAKMDRPASRIDEVVTAYRDGQVTARSLRRREGYTDSASVDPHGQGVEVGDVVVHGLDGFAGAIGDSEAAGNCSPVYHVCQPIDGGDSAFYGRLLRVLALDDYLSLFASSTRERAVDFRNWDRFGSIPVPRVPLTVQHNLGRHIVGLRPLRERVSRLNNHLTERRQALITAAVTGQIDVTTARGVAT